MKFNSTLLKLEKIIFYKSSEKENVTIFKNKIGKLNLGLFYKARNLNFMLSRDALAPSDISLSLTPVSCKI